MMQTIKKWQITIKPGVVVFYLYDNHPQNILRKLSEISFDIEPFSYEIILEPQPETTTSQEKII